jgi:hypothetical protein
MAKIDLKWNFSIFFAKSHFLNVIVQKTASNVFHDLKNVKITLKSSKIVQFWPFLANFSHIL